MWTKYFEGQSSITVAFWSALTEKERLEAVSHSNSENESDSDSDLEIDREDTTSRLQTEVSLKSDEVDIDSSEQPVSENVESKTNAIDCLIPDTDHLIPHIDTTDITRFHPPSSTNANLLTREELIDLILAISPVADDGLTTVGMV